MAVSLTDPPALQSFAAMRDVEEPRQMPMRVLVVDDARVLRTVTARMLTLQAGHVVYEAETYLDAVALLDAVDAVATDGFYPYRAGEATGPWGLALARLAREQGKRVVLVSGDRALVAQACGEGIRALEKPDGILRLVAELADKTGLPRPLEPNRPQYPRGPRELIGIVGIAKKAEGSLGGS